MIQYLERRGLGPIPQIWRLLTWMVGVLAVLALVFILILACFPDSALALRIAATLPVVVYPGLILYLLGRHGLLGGLWEITVDALYIWKPNGPSFRDAFVIDLLTSLTKAISDFTCSWCRWIYGDTDVISRAGLWVDDPTMCGSHYAAVSIAMALPYTIRLLQCLGEVYAARKIYPFLNAAKYVLCLVVLICSWLEAGGLTDRRVKIVILSYSIGGAIANMMSNHIPVHSWLHERPSGGNIWAYCVWVCFSDSCLRFSWVYKVVVKPPHSSLAIFIIAIAEVLRCYQWVYFGLRRVRG